MSVTMMVGADKAGNPNVEIVRNYPGHEEGRVSHARGCPHHNKHDLSGVLSAECVQDGYDRCWVGGPLYMETTHVGLVLSVGEHNHHDDSDFYAIVWDAEAGKPKEVEYATTRGWSYPNGAKVDATPEVRAAHRAYLYSEAEKARKEREEIAAKTPSLGKRVKVVRGRKVPVGTEGTIFWMGKAQSYSPSRWAAKTMKIGIRTSDRKDARGGWADVVWTYAENVEVVA